MNQDVINAKINKLILQKEKIQKKRESAFLKLLAKRQNEGMSQTLLVGLLISAEQLVQEHPNFKEVWQAAGERFLVQKRKYSKSHSHPTTDPSVSTPA